MADFISSVDALFSYYGATLFILGLLCCFYKRTFKFGVLTMLLADIPLALAIAFPKKVIEQLSSWGFQVQDMPDPQTGHTYGIIAGVVTFVVLFALRTLLNNMLAKRKAVPQKNEPSDDVPIDLAEDGPASAPLNTESKNEGGLFKGLAIKGKKSYQSASALHLSSDDNPLNLADAQAEFSALKKSEEHGELGKDLGSEPSFAQDPHDDFSLGSLEQAQSDDLKEPTLSSDVFKNHTSHNEPNFSNSFIENASVGSLKHNYYADQKALQNNQASVGIPSLGVQNPLTGHTDKANSSEHETNKSSWSSLFSKINQASQEQANKHEQDNPLNKRFSSLDGDDNFIGYGPKQKSSLDLDNLSFAGNKVGDLLDVIDENKSDDGLKKRFGIKENTTPSQSNDFNFADLLDSASKRQSALGNSSNADQDSIDSYDQSSLQPENVGDFGNDNLSPEKLSEEQLAYAALGKSHKTVAEALADLDLQEQDSAQDGKSELEALKERELANERALVVLKERELANERELDSLKDYELERDSNNKRSLEVDIASPDPSLQIMDPTKISYMYSDPVYEDMSKEEDEETQDSILDQYQGDATNYSFSIKGVFKSKPKLSVSGFVDRHSYLGQSQYEANFHEQELERMVNPNGKRPVANNELLEKENSYEQTKVFNETQSPNRDFRQGADFGLNQYHSEPSLVDSLGPRSSSNQDFSSESSFVLDAGPDNIKDANLKSNDNSFGSEDSLASPKSKAMVPDDLFSKREQILTMARQVAAQITAELEAKIGSSYHDNEQAMKLLSNDEEELKAKSSLPRANTTFNNDNESFALDKHHTDDNQDEAHALASLFAKKAPQNKTSEPLATKSPETKLVEPEPLATKSPETKLVEPEPLATKAPKDKLSELEPLVTNAYERKEVMSNEPEDILERKDLMGVKSVGIPDSIKERNYLNETQVADKNELSDTEHLDFKSDDFAKSEQGHELELTSAHNAKLSPEITRTEVKDLELPSSKPKATEPNEKSSTLAPLNIVKEEPEQAKNDDALEAVNVAKHQEKAQKHPRTVGASLEMLKAKAKEAFKNKQSNLSPSLPESQDNKLLAKETASIEKSKAELKSSSAQKETLQSQVPQSSSAIQRADSSIESKSTLNNRPQRATTGSKPDIKVQRGLAFIEKLKAKSVASKQAPATSQTQAPSKPQAQAQPAMAKPSVSKAVVDGAQVKDMAKSQEVKAPIKSQAQSKPMAATQAPSTSLVGSAKAQANTTKAPSDITQAKSVNLAKDSHAMAKSPAPSQSSVAKQSVATKPSTLGQASATAKQAQASAAVKPVQAVKPSAGTSVPDKASEVGKPSVALKPAQASEVGKPAQAVKPSGSGKSGVDGEVAQVKATLKNKKRHHKKVNEEEAIELSKEALIKDAALASMSSLDDFEGNEGKAVQAVTKAREQSQGSNLGATQGRIGGHDSLSSEQKAHALSKDGLPNEEGTALSSGAGTGLSSGAGALQSAEASSATGAVRKSASLKRSFSLKRNK